MKRIVHATAAPMAAVVLAGAALSAPLAKDRLDPQQAIARSEQAIGRIVGAYTLTDSTGASFALNAYRGKPLVISLIYSACSSICPPSTQHLIAAVGEGRRILGADAFEVLTVGFDARNDTPVRMAQFGATQGVKSSNWRLASGDAGTLEALLRDLGFSYATVAGGFDHIAQTTIIDRDGRVYRQVYGDDFPIRMLIEPLKDIIYGTTGAFTVGGLIDRIRLICTTYDPGAGRYRIDYGLVFGSVIAGLSLLLFGAVLLREWRRTARA
jgi:protein SCO1/2